MRGGGAAAVVVSTQAFATFGSRTALENDFLLGILIALGFAITVLAYSVVPIFGGHINPSVLFAFLILKNLLLTPFYFVRFCSVG